MSGASEGPNMQVRRATLAAAPCPCKSGHLTRDCHPYLLTPPTPEEFFAGIERGLALAPRLSKVIPTGYPRRGRAKLDYSEALRFEETRTSRYGHNFNLPLVLSIVGNHDAVPGARNMALQLLRLIEAFAKQFSGAPGAKLVLSPLWTQVHDANDPCFWSVIANCHFAVSNGDRVMGFERATGRGEKTTDLVLSTKDQRILLELEMWHDPAAASADVFTAEFRRRVEAKASAKFPDDFGSDRIGVVVEVAFLDEAQFKMLRQNRELLEPIDVSLEARWVGQLMVVVQNTNALGVVSGFEFLDYKSQLRSPPPPAPSR